MANKFHQGYYTVKNKEKYIGKKVPIYRSSWEFSMMQFLDFHTSVLSWGSEIIAIPYQDPLTGRKKNYFPDFVIVYLDRDGVKNAEIIEIKPANQAGIKKTKSKLNQAQTVRNMAKFAAASAYAEINGFQFRVITENELGYK